MRRRDIDNVEYIVSQGNPERGGSSRKCRNATKHLLAVNQRAGKLYEADDSASPKRS